jgi:hypothetical protein
MNYELIQINWLLLVAPFLWILGVAVFVALAGLMYYSRVEAALKCRDFIKQPFTRLGLLVGAGLIISGFLLNYAKLPSPQLIVVKIDKQKLAPIVSISTDASLLFSPKQLKMNPQNKSHILNNEKMKDNTMALLWDGYIQTPFIEFKKGDYAIEFQAKGSGANEEFARLKIEFEIPDANNYLRTRASTYIELTGKMETYRMNFHTTTQTIGRIRITYFNDIYIPETGEGRDVWIKDLEIKTHWQIKNGNKLNEK